MSHNILFHLHFALHFQSGYREQSLNDLVADRKTMRQDSVAISVRATVKEQSDFRCELTIFS